jgi:hypothetical protein
LVDLGRPGRLRPDRPRRPALGERVRQAYRILTSGDGANWTPAHTTTAGDGGFDDRYVRLEPTRRGTAYGYSLWEFGVYGWTGTASAGSGLPFREEARDGAGFILVWKRSTSW